LDEAQRGMRAPLEILGIDQLRPHLNKSRIIEVVRDALIAHADGLVQSPPPGQLMFSEPHGDCHIKFGHLYGASTFAIKVATGFYENHKQGLPVNHGLILIMDAKTGAPKTILKDDGWLTAWRTTAAAVLAVEALVPEQIEAIGVFGSGLQASLAVEWLSEILGDHSFYVCGRSFNRSQQFASKIGASAVANSDELFKRCNVVITATPSTVALFDTSSVRPGTHIVALGADSPGKQELPNGIFAKASCIVTDDTVQSLDHGDFGNAVRAGVVSADRAIMLGDVLSGAKKYQRLTGDITIADLTGIAAEDLAISGYFYEAMGSLQK
jgi:ornithine cyclodeaminase